MKIRNVYRAGVWVDVPPDLRPRLIETIKDGAEQYHYVDGKIYAAGQFPARIKFYEDDV